MKKIVLVFIAVVLTVSGFAQKSADIGIWGGSSTYFGDIKDVPPMQSFNLNFGAFFRYNINTRVGMRAEFLTGSFAADGLVQDVPWDFKKNVQGLSFLIEINYLKFILGEKNTPYTPYIMGGIGIMYFPYTFRPGLMALVNPDYPVPDNFEESVATPSIPFGFGIKFSIGSKLGIGVEYQLRKMLNDKLDDVDDPLSYTNDEGKVIKYTNILHNNDWPGYLGIYATYKINLDKKACPAYDRKYW